MSCSTAIPSGGKSSSTGDPHDAVPSPKRQLPPRDVQSMGWLTESSQQPKRQRYIEGVDGRGLPEMQAQLYKLEQQAAAKKASGQSLSKPRRVTIGALGAANAGVDTRNQKDLREAPTDANRIAASEAALEWKAQLYAKLARGEAVSADDESYNVDFFAKASDQSLPNHEALAAAANAPHSRLGVGAAHQDGRQPGAADREQWEADEREAHATQTAEEERRNRRVDAVFELEKETEEGRKRAADDKDRRKSREDQKRAALKATMVKQLASRLLKAKQAKQVKQAGN